MTTSFVRDGYGRATQVTWPNGSTSAYTYDGRSNIVQTHTVSATPTNLGTPDAYTAAGYDVTCTNAVKCNKPNWTREASGTAPTPAEIAPASQAAVIACPTSGDVTCYVYNPNGTLATVTSPANSAGIQPQTRYTYQTVYPYYKNSSGVVVQQPYAIQEPSGVFSCGEAGCPGTARESVKYLNFDQSGAPTNLLPINSSNNAGDNSIESTTWYTYDAVGNMLTKCGPLPGNACPPAGPTSPLTQYTYDLDRELVGSVGPDPDGPTGWLNNRATRITYNGLGEATRSEYGTVTDYSAAAFANFNPLERTDNTYDALGRKILSSLTTYSSYQSQGIQQQTQYTYDAAGNLVCTARRLASYNFGSPPGQGACTLNADGMTGASPYMGPTGQDGPDRITVNTYYQDSNPGHLLGKLQSVTEGAGTAAPRVTSTYTYTPSGQVATVADANNNLTTYRYDGYDRKSETDFPSPTTPGTSSSTDRELYTYDVRSRPSTTLRRDGTTLLTTSYDQLDEKTLVSDNAHTIDTTYTYDSLGRMLTAKNSDDTVSLTWDALGRKLSEYTTFLSNGSGWGASAAYDAAGNRTNLWYGNGTGFNLSYTYDVDNEVTAVQEWPSGVPTMVATMDWNNRGLLHGTALPNGMTSAWGWSPTRRVLSLVYTQPGNVTLESRNFSYTSAGQLYYRWTLNPAFQWSTTAPATSVGYGINGLNQVTSIGPTTLSYDARQNINYDGATYHGYDALNRLTSVTSASGSMYLGYDALGRLSVLNTGGTNGYQLQYDGAKLITEYDRYGKTLRWYAESPFSDAPLVDYEGSSQSNMTRHWVLQDENGSVMGLADANAYVTPLTYDEYGVPGPTNAGARFQYTGQMWLAEIGLYHYRARQYSPTLGRFYQTDPIGYGDGLNMYAYVADDPTDHTDPSGEAGCGHLAVVECNHWMADQTRALRDLRTIARAQAEFVLHPNSVAGREFKAVMEAAFGAGATGSSFLGTFNKGLAAETAVLRDPGTAHGGKYDVDSTNLIETEGRLGTRDGNRIIYDHSFFEMKNGDEVRRETLHEPFHNLGFAHDVITSSEGTAFSVTGPSADMGLARRDAPDARENVDNWACAFAQECR